MKTIATALAAIAMIAGSASRSEAREHYRESYHGSSVYISGRASCGTPIYTERYVVHVDRYGHAVWGTRILPVSYHHSRGGYGGHRADYGRNRGYDRGYGRGPSPRDFHDSHRDHARRVIRSIFR
ncbi:MAG: hypothetical protein EOP87_06790 [Verrucomicrobiaceae bacterium]|nr:MAG: hypothetical protein EOP87_06790 [Verrucomicrobiaceae bacterium]